MKRRRMEVILWAMTLAAGLWGVKRWNAALPAPAAHVLPPVESVDPVGPAPSARLLREAAATVERNPFRLDRAPTPAPLAHGFGPMAPGPISTAPPPPPFRPPLVVSGLVGPPWAAVVEGLPGREGGTVVRGGERFGDLRVRSVTPAAVVISSSDTTWRLTVRRTWQ